MTSKHFVLISLIAFTTFSCGKLLNKNDRSSGEAAAAATEESSASEDATVATEGVSSTDTKVDPAMALTGKGLYAKLCASCHQTLDKTDVPKASLAKINAAISKEATMAGLKDTAQKDLEAIAAALSEVSPGKGKGKEGEVEAEDETED